MAGQPQGAWAPGQPTEGGPPPWQVPAEDLDDNPDAQAPPPPQFDMGQLPQIQGYGNMQGIGQFSPLPPPPLAPPPPPPPAHTQFASCAQLTEEECREALLQFVSQHCCWGKGPANDMEMKEFLASTALRYKLETFCESRSTGYQQEPYRGQFVDGPQNGAPPPPWNIAVAQDSDFNNHVKVVEVPHTATVQMCHGCDGRGFNRCHRCYGRGCNRCISCHGSGQKTRHDAEHGTVHERCFSCGGDGRKRCMTCGGDGRVTCHTCAGCRSLKCYIALTVQFINHEEDFIIETTDMPDELVRTVQGNTVLQDTYLYCNPISGYPVPDVAQSSVNLMEKHMSAFQAERRLNQRQTLIAIPVTEVRYHYKEKGSRFWVYGLDKKIHFPDYPAKCCWGCTIL